SKYAPTSDCQGGNSPLTIEELRGLYGIAQRSKEAFQDLLSTVAWQGMSPWDRQRLAVQRAKVYAFLDLMGEIFGDELPVLVPSAVSVAEHLRVPTVKWTSPDPYNNFWLEKLEQAVCCEGCVQIRLGSHSNNLCCLDVDHNDLVEPFLAANPILHTTLQTFGSKGRHFWFYAEGDYPQRKKLIVCGDKMIE